MNPKTTAVGTALALVGALIAPGAALADPPPTSSMPTAAQVASLTPAEQALLASGAPQTIVMDPTTGDILSVRPAFPLSFDIVHESGCGSGDGCYDTNHSGNVNQGFVGGAGTIDGTWGNRNGYSAGNWNVSACWSGGCGLEIGPGSVVDFTSDVTGTSFTIH